jgi:hypothetical protein
VPLSFAVTIVSRRIIHSATETPEKFSVEALRVLALHGFDLVALHFISAGDFISICSPQAKTAAGIFSVTGRTPVQSAEEVMSCIALPFHLTASSQFRRAGRWPMERRFRFS